MAPSIAQEPIPQPEIQVKRAFDETTHQGVSLTKTIPRPAPANFHRSVQVCSLPPGI